MNALHDPAVVGPGAHQLQAGLLGEQRLAGTDRDRMDVQDVPVDQAQAHEPMRGPDAGGLLLEPSDDGGQLAVAPHNDQRRNSTRDTTVRDRDCSRLMTAPHAPQR